MRCKLLTSERGKKGDWFRPLVLLAEAGAAVEAVKEEETGMEADVRGEGEEGGAGAEGGGGVGGRREWWW